MILIENKENCCGCRACEQVCPKHCINMVRDEQGFAYPEVDASLCIECGLCEMKCPIINKNEASRPIGAYAANADDALLQLGSSSGGVFPLLAARIVNAGGVVFGAEFNSEWQVVHSTAETIEAINRFKGSKYVQSDTLSTYSEVRKYLKENRKILYSGTPCQIAGLKKFLGHDYENLITIDVICHGVPSPEIWQTYLNGISHGDKGIIELINFRSKDHGWENFYIKIGTGKDGKRPIVDKSMSKDTFMKYFLRDVILRPSCYDCQFRNSRSGSDITLGDFWRVKETYPEYYDYNGVSALIVNTEKGGKLVEECSGEMRFNQVAYEDIVKGNPSLVKSSSRHEIYNRFWKDYVASENESDKFRILSKYERSVSVGLIRRIKNRIKRVIRQKS